MKCILDAFKYLKRTISIWRSWQENRFFPKRGYNYKLVGGQTNHRSVKAKEVLDVFICCDGKNDLMDICTLTGLSFDLVRDITDFLAKDDLIVLAGEACDE